MKTIKEQSKVGTKGRRQRRKNDAECEDEKPMKIFKCKICDRIFDKSPLFTEHMRVAHSIDKPFECNICEKAYRIQSLLTEHYRSHTGEKPYHCERCDKRFLQLQPYKAHVR